MSYSPVNEIKVGLNFTSETIPVGRLAIRDMKIYFEYDDSFLTSGLDISPLRLKLQPGIQTFNPHLFEGLAGVFNDSLPDGWGRLLLDRSMRLHNFPYEKLTPLDRLAHVGNKGMGALIYEPDYGTDELSKAINLDSIAFDMKQVLDGEAEDVLANLLALNGSSAGARPKAVIGVRADYKHIIHGIQTLPNDYESWLVKFSGSNDYPDSGAIEYAYSLMAKAAGIDMSATHLFSAQKGCGYFAIKRFDRDSNNRIHMHSACGVLHSDFRVPSLDYEDLLALTNIITRDVREVKKMFRLAVFNVLAHNRDDHSKNFSFLMNKAGEWKLSPAYDLTFSNGPAGEQSMTVMGEGKNPTTQHLLKLAAAVDIKDAPHIIEMVQTAISNWSIYAEEAGVRTTSIKRIAKVIM